MSALPALSIPAPTGDDHQTQSLVEVEKWRKAIEENPISASYEEWLKAVQKLTPEEQRKAAEALENLVGNNAQALAQWAYALIRKNRPVEALEKSRQAACMDPNLFDAHFAMGSSFAALKRPAEAEGEYANAVLLSPESGFSGWLISLKALAKDERGRAISKLEEGIARQKQPELYWKSWGDALCARRPDYEPDYEGAEEKYRRAIRLDPNRTESLAQMYIQWGNDLLDSFRYQETVKKCEIAADLDERVKASAYLAEGNAFLAQKNYGKAERNLLQVLRLEPRNWSAYAGLGRIRYQQERYAEAEEMYRKAIELGPFMSGEFHQLCLRLGMPLFRQWLHSLKKSGETVRSEKSKLLEKVVETNPVALCVWGRVLFERGEYEEAIEKFEKAIQADPGIAEAYDGCGNAWRELGQFDKALEKYAQSAKASSDEEANRMGFVETCCGEAFARYKAGMVAHRQGDYEAAIAHYEASLKIIQNKALRDPTEAMVYCAFGHAQYVRNKLPEAEEMYRKAIESFPHNLLYFLRWAETVSKLEPVIQRQQRGRIESQISLWHAPDVFSNWGVALDSLGLRDEAIRQYQNAIRKDAKHLISYLRWGTVLADSGQYEKAFEKFQQALQISPNYAYAYHNLAHYHRKLGDYKKSMYYWDCARTAYEHNLPGALEEGNSSDFYYYAVLLTDSFGELDLAKKACLDGLNLQPDDVNLLILLGSIRKEQAAKCEANTPLDCAMAQENYRKAEHLLKNQLQLLETREKLTTLGILLLQENKLSEAEPVLSKVWADNQSAQVCTKLGILYSRKEEYQKAAGFYQKARELDPDDLNIRSNLADAYVKSKKLDQAEEIYEGILAIAPEHIDANIGLGLLYGERGENDADMYDHAILHLQKVIELARENKGSRRLKSKELAAVYYSHGYVCSRLYDKSKLLKDEEHLSAALENFRECVKLDSNHHKAHRAITKLESHVKLLQPQSALEKRGPLAITIPAALVFTMVQVAFWFHRPFELEDKVWEAMTLTALALTTVGVYMPRILKLKLGAVELEKSSVDQISTSSQPLQINR